MAGRQARKRTSEVVGMLKYLNPKVTANGRKYAIARIFPDEMDPKKSVDLFDWDHVCSDANVSALVRVGYEDGQFPTAVDCAVIEQAAPSSTQGKSSSQAVGMGVGPVRDNPANQPLYLQMKLAAELVTGLADDHAGFATRLEGFKLAFTAIRALWANPDEKPADAEDIESIRRQSDEDAQRERDALNAYEK